MVAVSLMVNKALRTYASANANSTVVGSNTSIFGKGTASGVKGTGFRVRQGTNVIFQNLALGPAPAKGDLIALDESTQIWVDHCTFTSVGLTGGKDDYDGEYLPTMQPA